MGPEAQGAGRARRRGVESGVRRRANDCGYRIADAMIGVFRGIEICFVGRNLVGTMGFHGNFQVFIVGTMKKSEIFSHLLFNFNVFLCLMFHKGAFKAIVYKVLK